MARTDHGTAERRSLRRALRARRRAVEAEQRHRVEAAIMRAVQALGAYRRAHHVGGYVAFDGEPSLEGLIRSAAGAGKLVYVPVLRGPDMQFARLEPGRPLRRNAFGILEPAALETIDARRLDLVLTPLVACDARGTRLGVGRGYYDRCFQFLARRAAWQRPKLLGVGYSFQQVDLLERMPWDVPLWALVTEHGVRRFQ